MKTFLIILGLDCLAMALIVIHSCYVQRHRYQRDRLILQNLLNRSRHEHH